MSLSLFFQSRSGSNLQSNVPVYQSFCNHSDSLVANAMLSVVKQMKKPMSAISQFDGYLLEYMVFIRQFQARVISNTEENSERLNFLLQYTTGEANKIVRSYSYLDSSIGYPSALRELEQRYGNPQVVCRAFITMALQWPSIKPNDSKGLDEYALFFLSVKTQLIVSRQ